MCLDSIEALKTFKAFKEIKALRGVTMEQDTIISLLSQQKRWLDTLVAFRSNQLADTTLKLELTEKELTGTRTNLKRAKTLLYPAILIILTESLLLYLLYK